MRRWLHQEGVLEDMDGGRLNTRYCRDRKNFLEKVGWSLEKRRDEIIRGENFWKEMIRKNRRLEKQEKERKIQESKYLKEQKNVLNRVRHLTRIWLYTAIGSTKWIKRPRQTDVQLDNPNRCPIG